MKYNIIYLTTHGDLEYAWVIASSEEEAAKVVNYDHWDIDTIISIRKIN